MQAERTFSGKLGALGLAAFLTKTLGFVRDALLIAVFGSGALTDAYYCAFRIINIFRRTVGEGAVNAGFIPAFEKEKAVNPDSARAFFSAAWTLVLSTSLILVCGGIIFRKEIALYTSYGFALRPEQLALTALLTAIFMPHLLFVNIAALFQATLNSHGKFFRPAAASACFSLAVILCLILIKRSGHCSENAIITLAWAASLSGLAQAALLIPMLKQSGYSLKFSNPATNTAAVKALLLSIPAATAMAQDQIALFVSSMFASFLEPGSVTAFYNAGRLMQFPISLFASSAAVAVLPELSQMSTANRKEEFALTLNSAFKTSALIIFPATGGLMTLSLPICQTLFEHGKVTSEAAHLTAGVLFYLAPGLVGFAICKLAASACYSAGDKKNPVKIMILQTALNTALAWPLMRLMGASGLALAATVSALAGSAIFLKALPTNALSLKNNAGFYFKLVISVAIMSFFCLAGLRIARPLSPLLLTVLLVPLSITVYLAALKFLGVSERTSLPGGIGKWI